MDLGTIIGLLLGFGLVAWGATMHGHSAAFVDVPAAILVFGGAFAATLVMFPLRQVLGLFRVSLQCFLYRLPDTKKEIQRFTDLALKARREGLLSLENHLADVRDPFLLRGLEMVIDGTPREKIEESLFTELACIQERHASGKRIYDQIAGILPAFGMIGTVVGLIQMLSQLDDPSKIGAGMAMAMVATLYGSLAAHLVFQPMAVKLETRSRDETILREIMIRGLGALADGETPKAIESRLLSCLSPRSRQLPAAV